MKKINLTKIKFPSTPTKEITVTLAGEKQTFEIRPVFGKALFKISLLSETKDKEEIFNALVDILSFGCDVNEEAAKQLIEIDMPGAMQIVNEVMALTNEFVSEKSKEEENAKKTLKGEKKQKTS